MRAPAAHQYDLPFWYQGTLTDASFPVRMNVNNLVAMGKKNGYQHLWLNADLPVKKDNGYVTLFTNDRFYTTIFNADPATHVALVTTGANDPNNNLRTEKAFIIRQPSNGNQSVISITETHGGFNPSTEAVSNAAASISELKILLDTPAQTVFSFRTKKRVYTATINYNNQQNFFQIN
jgi:hypothetical protein